MEITLFDQYGKPTAYLDNMDENTIWLWDGRAVAYLDGAAVIGWNGNHLGWFINGVIYDVLGYQAGFTSETCPRFLKFEPFKKFKKFKRFKRFKKYLKAMRSLKASRSELTLQTLLESGGV